METRVQGKAGGGVGSTRRLARWTGALTSCRSRSFSWRWTANSEASISDGVTDGVVDEERLLTDAMSGP